MIVFLYRKRKETEKSSIMTMILRQSPPGHKTRCLEEDVVLAIDNATKNVIHYQKVQDLEEFEFPLVCILICDTILIMANNLLLGGLKKKKKRINICFFVGK